MNSYPCCEHDKGCNILFPTYNVVGQTSGRFCKDHKLRGMKNVKPGCHHHEGCGIKQPTFNFDGQPSGRFCSNHSLDGMLNVLCFRCEHPDGCPSTSPAFNFDGQIRGRLCGKHKLGGMINLRSPLCVFDGCESTNRSFNWEDAIGGRFCAQHKTPGMIDFYTQRCESHKCPSLKPSFAWKGEIRGRFCWEHQTPGMVNVRAAHCAYDGCPSTHRAYNWPGETGGRFCATHRLPGMDDLVSPLCENHECASVKPFFNFKDQTGGRFCFRHRLTGMINVVSPRCEYDECTSVKPCYNFTGHTVGIRCFTHQLHGMIKVSGPRCQHRDPDQPQCNKSPSYGFSGYASAFCTLHHPAETLRASHLRCSHATFDGCTQWATHGTDRYTPQRCKSHATDVDVCLVEQLCTECQHLDVLNRDGLCVTYCSKDEVDAALRLRHRLKEMTVGNWLREDIRATMTSANQAIDTHRANRHHVVAYDLGTHLVFARFRPDFVYRMRSHVLVIEVDEHKHTGYGKVAEHRRMFEIGQSFGGVPVCFIRYNPDTYSVKDGVNRRSITADDNSAERRATLVNVVKHCLTHDDSWMTGFQVKYLFFDDYSDATDTVSSGWTHVHEEEEEEEEDAEQLQPARDDDIDEQAPSQACTAAPLPAPARSPAKAALSTKASAATKRPATASASRKPAAKKQKSVFVDADDADVRARDNVAQYLLAPSLPAQARSPAKAALLAEASTGTPSASREPASQKQKLVFVDTDDADVQVGVLVLVRDNVAQSLLEPSLPAQARSPAKAALLAEAPTGTPSASGEPASQKQKLVFMDTDDADVQVGLLIRDDHAQSLVVAPSRTVASLPAQAQSPAKATSPAKASAANKRPAAAFATMSSEPVSKTHNLVQTTLTFAKKSPASP